MNDHKNTKNISRTSSGVVLGIVGSVPSYAVSTNNRVLIYCTCHFQGSSLCFSFFCLLVSSVSEFHPNTRRAVVDTFFRLICLVVLSGGRDASTKEHWRVLAVSQPHWACPHSRRVCPPCPHCSGSRLLHPEPSEAGPGLQAPPRSKCSGSGTRVVLRGADSVGPAFCALPRSEQLR